MTQPAGGLARAAHNIRRRWILIGDAAVLGLLVGAAVAASSPSVFTSNVLVVVQPRSATYIGSQIVIADSNPVLSAALPHLSPAVSVQALRADAKVTKVTNNIFSISAWADSPAQAENTANAIAQSYVTYIRYRQTGLARHLDAAILQPATRAVGVTPLSRLPSDAGLGLLFGALLAVALATTLPGRRPPLGPHGRGP